MSREINRSHTITLRRDAEGDWVARVEELRGCTAHGATQRDALVALEHAKREWMEAAREDGIDIPEPAAETPRRAAEVARLRIESAGRLDAMVMTNRRDAMVMTNQRELIASLRAELARLREGLRRHMIRQFGDVWRCDVCWAVTETAQTPAALRHDGACWLAVLLTPA